MIWHDEYAVIIVGRLLFGLAHGCIYVTLICHAGENTVKEMRGRVLSLVGFVTATAAFILVSSSFDNYIHPNHLIGIVSITISIIGIFLSRCFSKESVVFLLQRGHHLMALDNVIKLRNEPAVSSSTQKEFNELQQYVANESTGSLNIFQTSNLRPLGLVTGLRYITFISNNLLLNVITSRFIRELISHNVDTLIVASLLLTAFRMLFALTATVLGDNLGRRTFIAVSGGGGGLFMLIAAIILTSIDFTYGLGGLAAFFLICNIFFGFGLDTTPHVVASEVFPLRKKAMSIAFTEIFIHVTHIGSIVLVFVLPNVGATDYVYLWLPAVLILILTAVMYKLMPETHNKSLQQNDSEINCGVKK